MKPANFLRDRMLLPLALACATLVAAAPAAAGGGSGADANARHLIYLPSRAPAVDHAANVRAFEEQGFLVHMMGQGSESDTDYIFRVRDEVRGLIDRGVPPSAITVLGSGRGSPAAAMVSAATGHRQVNYVMLGRCELALTDDPNFRMSGRVLGLRDAEDRNSRSCRPLWRNSPRVTQRRDVVVHTGLGASLFNAPREAWLRPVAEWSSSGRVNLGEVKVAANR